MLTFPVLVSFLLCAFKGSLQTLLDDLCTTLDGHSLRAVSKSAVSQARQKLKATDFEALNDSLIGLLNELLPEPRWQELRLVATDSTTLRLPPWLENQTEFGVPTDSRGQPYLLARALGLFSTTSKLMIKTVLGRFDDAERALLVQLASASCQRRPVDHGSWGMAVYPDATTPITVSRSHGRQSMACGGKFFTFKPL